MKITVDRTRCTGLGVCESLTSDVFEVNDDGDLELRTDSVPDGQLDEVETAVEQCPTGALSLS